MSLTKGRDGIEVHTPEIDKLMAIPEERRTAAQEFYDWIHAQGWRIAQWIEGPEGVIWWTPELVEIPHRPDVVMGMFLGIDPKKISDEKDAIVRALQEKNRGDEAHDAFRQQGGEFGQ